jgi:hypothetical protein
MGARRSLLQQKKVFAELFSKSDRFLGAFMHVCLVIDVLTAIFLVHGLYNSSTRFRRQLCLASLIFLGFVSLRTYLSLARYFGFFERHVSLATYGLDALLRFFGGFWMLFGVLVLARAVTWIGLAFAIYAIVQWTKTSRSALAGQTLKIGPPQE